MSRIGKISVAVPKAVKIFIENGSVRLEGSKGKLAITLPDAIKVEQKDEKLFVSRSKDTKQARADHGTTRAHLVNMIAGVMQGHKKELEIQGVGFRAQMQGNKLIANLGFSHPLEFEIPKNVSVTAPKPTMIVIEGPDKALVGRIAAAIRKLKPPEPYKGKGIRYANEIVRKKQGKSVTK
jgi:large subunit ribosomal protein L6